MNDSRVDEQRERCLYRIGNASPDWCPHPTWKGVEFVPDDTAVGLVVDTALRRSFRVRIPAWFWDNVDNPVRVDPTDPVRTPAMVSGLLTWTANHYTMVPLADRYATNTIARILSETPPSELGSDSETATYARLFHACTLVVTGCVAAKHISAVNRTRRASVAAVVPALMRTLLQGYQAPPELAVALLSALTSQRIITNTEWLQSAERLLTDDQLHGARALGYEAAAITPGNTQWARDLITSTYIRLSPAVAQPSTAVAPPPQTDGVNDNVPPLPASDAAITKPAPHEADTAKPADENGERGDLSSQPSPPSSTPSESDPTAKPSDSAKPSDENGERGDLSSQPSPPSSTPSESDPTAKPEDRKPTKQQEQQAEIANLMQQLTEQGRQADRAYSKLRRSARPPKSTKQKLKLDDAKKRVADRSDAERNLSRVFPPNLKMPMQEGDTTDSPWVKSTQARGPRQRRDREEHRQRTMVTWHRPLPSERRLSRQIERQLRRAKMREPSIVDYWRPDPPGRVDMRMAMQEDAFRSMGIDVEVPVFRATEISAGPEPELAVGFAVDISGSMTWASEIAPSVCWCLLRAVHALGGRTAAVRFCGGVHPLFAPGKVPNLVPRFEAKGRGEHSYVESLLTLDAALHLSTDREAARVIFVFSDGQLGNAQNKAGRALAERMVKRGGVKFVWVAVPPAEPRAPGEFVSLTPVGHKSGFDTQAGEVRTDLAKSLAKAVESALRTTTTKPGKRKTPR